MEMCIKARGKDNLTNAILCIKNNKQEQSWCYLMMSELFFSCGGDDGIVFIHSDPIHSSILAATIITPPCRLSQGLVLLIPGVYLYKATSKSKSIIGVIW